MEPERKIEKLLWAYAKRRRGQAGDPLKLHPATRHLLQGEIARNAPRPDEEDASMTLWELFRQQWAFLLGFTLIIFFGAMLLLPSLSKAKFKAQQAMAMNNLKQVGVAAQTAAEENNGRLPASLDALTNGFLTDKVLTDPENGEQFAYVAGGESLDNLQSNAVLAYSSADKDGRAVLFANGDVQWLNDARFSELTNRGLSQLVAANGSARRQPAEAPTATMVKSGNAAAAPLISGRSKSVDWEIAVQNAGDLAANSPAAPATTFDRLVTQQTNSVQIASTASQKLAFGLQNSFRNTVTPAQIAPVLAKFQVQQNGSAIRVVDADGSVYDGALQWENVVALNGLAGAATPSLPVTAPSQVVVGKTIANRDESQTVQNYFFRVTGMNRTLKQNVVFTGNLLANFNTTTNLQQSFDGKSGFGEDQLQYVFTNQLPWSSSRIAGTAVIAGTNNIEINAEPLIP